MLVPAVLAANTSPVAGLASVTVMDNRFGPSSVIEALAASVMTTGETPFQLDVKPVPAAAPFKSTVGGVLITAILIVASLSALVRPTASVAKTLTVTGSKPGPPAVLL